MKLIYLLFLGQQLSMFTELTAHTIFFQAMIHVSTAFANCNHLHIEEKFYDLPHTYEEILHLLKSKDDPELDAMTPG